MLLSGLVHGHTVVLQILEVGRVYVSLGLVTASVWWPIVTPEDNGRSGSVPGFRDAIRLLRELGVEVDNVDPEEIECDLNGEKGTWSIWPRPEHVLPADLPGAHPYEVTWGEAEGGGYSTRATPVDNDGVTCPTLVCNVAFITEDARTAALT